MGTAACKTHDNKRHGTTSLFAVFGIVTGAIIAKNCRKHTQNELVFLLGVDRATQPDLELHLMLDDYAKRVAAFNSETCQGFERRGLAVDLGVE